MPKFFGKVGFAETYEDPNAPGVWAERIVEREYYGDINRVFAQFSSPNKVNEDVSISHSISIIADAYASENYTSARFVRLYGRPISITSVEVQRPRLIFSLGSLWNGPTDE